MTRATLGDRVDRVCRDPARKLGYDDRFFGTMRLAWGAGIRPIRLALGAAAAAVCWWESENTDGGATTLTPDLLRRHLLRLWNGPDDPCAQRVAEWAAEGLVLLQEAFGVPPK